MSGRAAVLPAAALWVGILAGRAWAVDRPELAGVFAAATGIAALLAGALAGRRPPGAGAAFLALAVFAAGAGRGVLLAGGLTADRSRLAEAPFHRLRGVIDEPPAGPPGHARAAIRIERALPPLPRGTRVRLRLPESPEVAWGERVECLAELVPPDGRRNPGGWDARASADAGGLAANGRAIALRRVGVPWPGAMLARTGVRWRRAVERSLAAHLSPEARELTLPLVTGDRGEFPAELDADFRASGLVHLLALSGLHVSALAAAARAAAASLGGGVGARAAAGVLAALFYVAIAGPLPSLARAAFTEGWVAGARLARRPVDPIQALAVSALVLLALRPGWALDLGFQLSCAASLGLARASAWSEGWPVRLRNAAAPLLATLAAQALCAPLLVARVHGFAWPALVANLVAVPIGGLLLAAAWLAVAAELAAPGSGGVFFAACEVLARGLVRVTHAAAGWPSALVATGHEPGVAVLAAAGALLLAIGAAAPRDLERCARGAGPAGAAALAAGVLASALAVALAASARELRPPPGTAWVVALDVGQGDATAIGTADGWWLVDAGPRMDAHDAGERVVNPFLRWAAIRRLETLVLTHDDGDHTGGAAAVRRRVAVRRVLAPVTSAPARGVRRVAAGETLATAPRVRVRWPPATATAVRDRGDNAGGLVLEIAEGPVRVLLPADVDSLVEAQLEMGGPLALLKAGHHGSASSSGAAWLARARPRVAWVSAGARNAYGHPSAGALERLGRAGARIDRTDREGALWYELSARGVRRIDWRSGAAERRRGNAWRAEAAAGLARAGAPRAP